MADFNGQDEIIVGNRRLRKVKRPKQHAGPIGGQEFQNMQRAPAPEATNLPYINEEPVYQPSNNQLYSNQVQDYQSQEQQNYVEDDAYSYNEPALETGAEYMPYNSVEKKKVLWIALGCLFLGVLVGKFFLGTSQVVQNGLQGVVINPEVPKGRSRCGVAEKTQGCVLYVMNPQRQELNGRDFYDLASQLTGRQRFMIETGNMRYSSYKIKPGSIAQLNIPPLQ